MAEQDLIDDVVERMAQLKVTQSELALACGLSQAHLSKVLARRVKLARKTRRRLTDWLEIGGAAPNSAAYETVSTLAARLESIRPSRHMQIMQLLKAIEQLVDGDEDQESARGSKYLQ